MVNRYVLAEKNTHSFILPPYRFVLKFFKPPVLSGARQVGENTAIRRLGGRRLAMGKNNMPFQKNLSSPPGLTSTEHLPAGGLAG
jgi:hypothetical protein